MSRRSDNLESETFPAYTMPAPQDSSSISTAASSLIYLPQQAQSSETFIASNLDLGREQIKVALQSLAKTQESELLELARLKVYWPVYSVFRKIKRKGADEVEKEFAEQKVFEVYSLNLGGYVKSSIITLESGDSVGIRKENWSMTDGTGAVKYRNALERAQCNARNKEKVIQLRAALRKTQTKLYELAKFESECKRIVKDTFAHR